MERKNIGLERRRKLVGTSLISLFIISTGIAITALAVLLVDTYLDGSSWLSWHFITNYPSRFPDRAGLRSALLGSIWIAALTGAISFPLGVGSAVYLHEYAPKNRLTSFINLNIFNLSGVPSIVYGLLGLGLFVDLLALGRSIIAGALTMGLLVLPMVIVAAREALGTVPLGYRFGGYALGATQWQVVRRIVLPAALPGILTGTVLAMSRAIGEAAPMIAISALVYITFDPTSALDRFTVLPIQIFNWVSRPQEAFAGLAAAGIIVLLVVLLAMNAIAIVVRDRYQKRVRE
jgi:phosphate transport system permease protein